LKGKKERAGHDAKLEKRIAKAEEKAKKYPGVDEGLIQRIWELVNLFPELSSPELERRTERFILMATPGEFYRMQAAIAEMAVPYLIEEPKVKRLFESLEGKQLGLAIKGIYESTLTFGNCYLTVERGINDGVPVLSCESRRDYADAILSIKDPVKMILGRRIRASHKLKLLKWTLPHVDILRDKDIFLKYLSYQPVVEKTIEENLTRMGY